MVDSSSSLIGASRASLLGSRVFLLVGNAIGFAFAAYISVQFKRAIVIDYIATVIASFLDLTEIVTSSQRREYMRKMLPFCLPVLDFVSVALYVGTATVLNTVKNSTPVCGASGRDCGTSEFAFLRRELFVFAGFGVCRLIMTLYIFIEGVLICRKKHSR